MRLEQATETRSSSGEVTRTWAVVATMWVAIRPLSGREYIEAQAIKATVTHQITCRYRPVIRPAMRLVSALSTADRVGSTAATGTRTFEIDHVIDQDDRHQWQRLLCREVT